MSIGFALALLFAAGWLPVFVFRTETWRDVLPVYTPSERFWVTATPVLLTIHFAAGCLILSTTADVPAWRALAGAGLFGLGLAVWFWARSAIAPLDVRLSPDQPPREFRRDGPFGLVRNPLYFACLLALAAPVVATGAPALVASYALCLVALWVRAVQEERRLHAQLGGVYADYCREVKRLIPFVL